MWECNKQKEAGNRFIKIENIGKIRLKIDRDGIKEDYVISKGRNLTKTKKRLETKSNIHAH